MEQGPGREWDSEKFILIQNDSEKHFRLIQMFFSAYFQTSETSLNSLKCSQYSEKHFRLIQMFFQHIFRHLKQV